MINRGPDCKPQVALAALLEENARAELRAKDLEQRLEQAGEIKRTVEARAETLEDKLEDTRQGAIGTRVWAPAVAAAADSCAIGAEQPSKILADTAAEARAAASEAALSEALTAVEELESRCAQAQARELEIERESAAQIEALKRKWEEATSNGPKASFRSCL